MPDPGLERPNDELSKRDLVPPTERGQDVERTDISHGLTTDGSRPLTAEEKKAADVDTPLPERVYAPASERLPVDPVPGHRDFVQHTDESTPERREAASEATGAPVSGAATPGSGEPSFTRVERPSAFVATGPGAASTGMPPQAWQPSGASYTPPASSYPAFSYESETHRSGWMGLPMGLGTVVALGAAGIGAWWWMRRRRERNKPINRLRRQAQQAALEFRGRVPSRDDLPQPDGMRLAATLVPIGLMLWRQAQARQSDAVEAVTDADWQKRLAHLKERWTPHRVEREKFSISRH